jgi:hypothetical protein
VLFNTGGQQLCTTYAFKKDTTGNTGLITFADPIGPTTQYDVYISHDTLSLYPHGFADAFAAYYVPVSKHFDWCSNLVH